MVTVARLLQYAKTPSPTVPTLSGSTTLVSERQEPNARAPIARTVFGSVKFLRAVQLRKASSPIVCTFEPNVTLSSFVSS